MFKLQRSNPIPLLQQILAALRFYATESFHVVNGDLHEISTPSVCRIVHKVSRALANKVNQKIKFPMRAGEVGNTKHDFYMKAGFPGKYNINSEYLRCTKKKRCPFFPHIFTKTFI